MAPPFTGVAVSVTGVPAQTGLAVTEIVMLTGSSGLTVMVIWFDGAGLFIAQVALDVSTQDTTSLFKGV